MDLSSEITPRLAARRLPGIDAGSEMLLPSYDGLSIASLPGTIARLLEAPPFGLPPLDEAVLSNLPSSVQRVVLLVLDGLGYHAFLEYLADPEIPLWRSLLKDAVFTPLTSVSPSTTASALTTLWTGALPAAHGIVGYEMWLKEYGVTANMIQHSVMAYANDFGGLSRAGFKPEEFMPLPTLAGHLAQGGIHTHAYLHASIARSGLSAMHLQGASVIPFRNSADLWVGLDHHLRRGKASRSYTYIYWGDLDELAHRYGPQDRRVRVEFASFSRVFEEVFLKPSLRQRGGSTLVMVTADHGLVHTPRQPALELRSHPAFLDLMPIKPTGENRMAYLFACSGCLEEVRRYVETAWPGRFLVLPSADVLASGLLGGPPHHPLLASRLGDWVLFARGDAYLWWARKENPLLGRHGGLSPQEMVVPFLALQI